MLICQGLASPAPWTTRDWRRGKAPIAFEPQALELVHTKEQACVEVYVAEGKVAHIGRLQADNPRPGVRQARHQIEVSGVETARIRVAEDGDLDPGELGRQRAYQFIKRDRSRNCARLKSTSAQQISTLTPADSSIP
jgi:hypothetical protein